MPNPTILERLAKLYEAEPELVPEGWKYDDAPCSGKIVSMVPMQKGGTFALDRLSTDWQTPPWFLDLALGRLVRWLGGAPRFWAVGYTPFDAAGAWAVLKFVGGPMGTEQHAVSKGGTPLEAAIAAAEIVTKETADVDE